MAQIFGEKALQSHANPHGEITAYLEQQAPSLGTATQLNDETVFALARTDVGI